MRIISAGHLPDETMHGSCNSCHCLVEVDRHEAKDSPDQREPGRYVDCPTKGCGGMIWLKPGIAPRRTGR